MRLISKTNSVTLHFFAFLAKVDLYLTVWQVKKKNMYVGTFWARTSLSFSFSLIQRNILDQIVDGRVDEADRVVKLSKDRT